MKKAVMCAALVSILSGCGGGGGSSSSVVASTLDFPVDGAIAAYVQSAHHFVLNGYASSAGAISATIDVTPNSGTTTFQNHTVQSAVQTVTLYASGSLQGSTASTGYFTVSPYTEYGNVDSDGQETVTTSTTVLPTTAKVGQSGAVDTSTTYSNSTHSSVVSTQTDTWSLEADTASTAWLCVTTSSSDGSVEKDCYEINSSGNVLGLKSNYKDNQGTFSLQST